MRREAEHQHDADSRGSAQHWHEHVRQVPVTDHVARHLALGAGVLIAAERYRLERDERGSGVEQQRVVARDSGSGQLGGER